jgi:hypothetical protein
MKTLLGSLMCLVLTVAQSFAISGGPWGGSGRVTVTGTYAGVFVPIVIVVDPGPPPVTLPPDNSLALFTLKVPQTGLASGTAVVFRNGIAYSGTIQGSADPDSAKLTGVVDATFEEDNIVLADGSKSIKDHYDAKGQFQNTKIGVSNNSFVTRIRGKASLTYTTNACMPGTTPPCPPDSKGDSGGPIDYKVRGFKQSESSS